MSKIYQRHMLQLDGDDDNDNDEEEAMVRLLQGASALGGSFIHNETSSESDDTDSDDMYKEHHVRFRDPKRVYRQNSRDDSDDESEVASIPEWFSCQHFQHSRKLIPHFILGAVIIVLLGGDLLIGAAVTGSLITYLLRQAGLKNSSNNVIIGGTVCCVMVVGYSTSPLLWKSVLNIVPLVSASVFTVLTGSWILLMMEDFCRDDPEQAMWLETMLFTLYPISSLVLVTWLVSFAYGGIAAPYMFMLFGFSILWIVQAPTQSSFVKHGTSVEDAFPLVLDQPTVIALLAGYICSPASLGLLWCLGTRRGFLVSLVEVLLQLSGTIFLSSFLHLRHLLDTFGIRMRHVLVTRWSSAALAIVAMNFLLHLQRYKSLWLPWWLLVFLCEWAAFALLLGRNRKRQSHWFAFGFLLHILLLALQLPWGLQHVTGGSEWPVQSVFLLVVCNAVICVICALASRFHDADVFGMLVLLQSLVFVPVKSILADSRLISPSLSVLITAIVVMVQLRLFYVKKLPPRHCLLSVSLHVSSLLETALDYDVSDSVGWGPSSIPYPIQFLALYAFVSSMLRVLVFEKSDQISTKQMFLHITSVAVTSFLSSWLFFAHLYVSLMRQVPVTAQFIGFIITMTSLPVLKFSLYHKGSFFGSSATGIVSVAAGILLVYFRPELSLTWDELPTLCSIIGGLSFVVLLTKLKTLRSQLITYVLCLLTGLPLGIVAAKMVCGSNSDVLVPAASLCGLQTSVAIAMTLAALQQQASMEKRLTRLCWTSAVIGLGMVLLDIRPYYTDDHILLGVLGAGLAAVFVSAVLRLSSLSQLPHLQVQKETRLPTLGNVAAIIGFLLLAIGWPHRGIPLELWLVGCSLTFFLLRKDKYIVKGVVARGNHYAPTVTATSVILLTFSIGKSSLWTWTSWWLILSGLVEMLFVFMTTPVLISLWIYVWELECAALVQRYCSATFRLYTVVLVTPVFLFLFVCGTSYTAWALAAFGFSVGAWTWRWKFRQITVF